ncbi:MULTISPECIES: hypothetical protein [unclassified Mesorhizobium]|uniref:hypothetical protein n=1 Tax=unclassified Mesorhizobium TaxID=325217 RepID=UPI0033351E15
MPQSVSFTTPVINLGRRTRGDIYLGIPSEAFATEIGKSIISWGMFENAFNVRLEQLLRHLPLPEGERLPHTYGERRKLFAAKFSELEVNTSVAERLAQKLLRAEDCQRYRNAVAHSDIKWTMDFRDGEAFPAIQIELRRGKAKELPYVTLPDMEALSEDLLLAGGLLSALSITAGDAWPAKALGDREVALLRSIFTGDALE